MKCIIFIFILCSQFIFAGDATSCIQLRSTNNAQMMKNTCAEPIVVYWCHSMKAECGKDGRYYQLSTVIEPNKENGNLYSTPLGVNIEYAACYGDYNSFKRTDDKGGYICKEPKKLPDNMQVMTSTAGAHTQEESCASAKKLAQKDADIGECSCELRGKTYICKVQSTVVKIKPSVVDSASSLLKKEINNFSKCGPTNGVNCPVPKPLVNPGGRRG